MAKDKTKCIICKRALSHLNETCRYYRETNYPNYLYQNKGWCRIAHVHCAILLQLAKLGDKKRYGAKCLHYEIDITDKALYIKVANEIQ